MGPTLIRISSTERCAAALALGALLLAAPGAAPAETLRGSATPGLRLYFPDDDVEGDALASYFDRWEHLPHEDHDVPWFLDFLHLDVGLWRDDETPLVRLERWSPFSYGENGLFDLSFRGLDLDADFYRHRIDELRATPRGTGQDGENVLPRLGSLFHDDSDPEDRFLVRRHGGGGELRLRPDGLDLALGPLAQLALRGRHEDRTGSRQDRFLLDDSEVGSGDDDARFRGITRALDQEVTSLGASLVLGPAGLATGVLDVDWERFREDAPFRTVGDLAALDPSGIQPDAEEAARALDFIPDTERWSGALRLSRRIGEASVHGGAYASRLRQAGRRPPAQRAAGLSDNTVTSVSAHAAADVPLGRRFALDAFGKLSLRDNGIDRGTALFAPDNGTQVDPFLDDLRTWEGGAELAAALAPGARAAAGWRVRSVERGLDFADTLDVQGRTQRVIRPEFALVGDESRTHALYLRSNARLLRRLRVSGELGFEWSPEIGSPIDLEHATYGRARASHTWARPLPLTVALFGSFLDGSGDGLELESVDPARSKDKDFERSAWDWGATLSAAPGFDVALFATATEQRDERRFPQVRSNVPRFNGPPFLEFFLDSEFGWRSDVRMLAAGATRPLGARADLALTGTLTWVSGDLVDGGTTGEVLETVNEIDLEIASLEAALGFQLRREIRVGLAWRSDDYRDDALLDEPDLNGWQHALTLWATFDLGALAR